MRTVKLSPEALARRVRRKKAEEITVFGLQEQMGSREGFISRRETMTQKQADEINAKMYCIKWVRAQYEAVEK